MDRNDKAFKALLLLPWTNATDQYMFFVTVKHLMPKARIAVRHIRETVEVDGQDTEVKGFRLLVKQKEVKWAVHAILMAI